MRNQRNQRNEANAPLEPVFGGAVEWLGRERDIETLREEREDVFMAAPVLEEHVVVDTLAAEAVWGRRVLPVMAI